MKLLYLDKFFTLLIHHLIRDRKKMSGYLEVKYPSKSNLSLNPFKSWKRQWCILRPSPMSTGGGSLAVYCSEAGAPAGTVDLPSSCLVRRAKSRTRPFAFAVFSDDEPRKPRILLAAQTLNEAHVWMEKIKNLLNGNKLLGTETLLKDSYSVTVLTTGLSRKCGMHGDSVLTVSSNGLLISRSQKLGTVLEWKHISNVMLISENAEKNKICVLNVDSDYASGGGELKFSGPLASELAGALRLAVRDGGVRAAKALSKSEGDLRAVQCSDGELRRSSWYSGPTEVSLDDIDIVMSKEAKRIPSGQLARCSGDGHLAPHRAGDDSILDRRSLVSVASGIYEEIADSPPPLAPALAASEAPAAPEAPEAPASPASDLYCPMGRDVPDGLLPMPRQREEPTYESVVESMYATVRRARPPPLPPRTACPSVKLGSWSCRCGASASGGGGEGGSGGPWRHGSLGSLPRCCGPPPRTLPKPDKPRQSFSVFRKRLKSDSRIACSPKSDSKENKDVETKKKKFDFTPTRDIFKSFKVSRKMRGLKIGKEEAKSCEYLDDTEHVTAARAARSVDCLDDYHRCDDADLSIEFNEEAVTTLALPQEIVDLILRGREQFKIRLKDTPESDYLPMSPIVPQPPIEHQYMVMSPRTNLA